MNKNDLRHRLSELIKEEVHTVLNERTYKYGGLLDPKNFDPVDPDVHIVGFGTLKRSALRDEIARRLEGAVTTASDAATGSPGSYRKFKALQSLLEDGGVLNNMISAEIEIADQLEDLRIKGGRRATPIPKQR